jgi:catechol 2,3-dioxygenase-like lactoylglutathione lyase family enzyme
MKLIHTCYRITDIDRSVAFYEALGFAEVSRIPIGDEAINVFMNIPTATRSRSGVDGRVRACWTRYVLVRPSGRG